MLRSCQLCPRKCGVDRLAGNTGFCRMGRKIRAARASLHQWEEPCISGKTGSGTVFFAGCSLGCIYCQNAAISFSGRTRRQPDRKSSEEKPSLEEIRPEDFPEISEERLSGIFLELQRKGASNINLVTAAHFVPQVVLALLKVKNSVSEWNGDNGNQLRIPVVYNTSGYELPETIDLMEGLTDIYLPDFRYLSPDLAREYSQAADYPEYAARALERMVRQVGTPVFSDDGMMKRGVIVRVLLLPGHVAEACRIVDYLYQTYGNDIYISLLNQYTPMPAVKNNKLLGRKVTAREYSRLVDHAISIGIVNGYIQEGGTAAESFIPSFNGEGIRSEIR